MNFSSKQELYERVKPALKAKQNQFTRYGYNYIQDVDIWNYLIESNWKNAHDLMLSDIVSDIMHVSFDEVDNFVKENLRKEKREVILEN